MGLNENIEEIKKLLEVQNQQKEKKFKLPFGKKVSKGQAKKNFITVMKINENGAIDFKKTQIEDQSFMEDGIPRLGTPEYMLQWKGKPMVVLPSWSVKPFCPIQNHKESLEDNSNTKGYKILLAKMLSTQVTPQKKMSGIIKWIIGLGLVAIVIYAFLG